ncbi:YheC/YheD family endospore coat-associated protein [Sutcliffiella rhizosphaerae]|uniref:Endospore coat-associated protein YheD n=1 Tax=Sutcliffiella rhizosphaerae TaxID=2880967 RepID=A0ABM8YRD5_9BACI|nr:YheC/YheD family protein [Sutcliffiella rhizosphaerae]CAG9622567.1 Endospore coat-associated protein YheD [Sutcliffiella rhizosphaerae]
MISLGVLSFSLKSSYFTKIAENIAPCGVKLFVFSPAALHFDNHSATGYVYNHERKDWEEAAFPIPSFIYDRCYYTTKETFLHKQAVERLKANRKITFLGYGLPDKWQVYKSLCDNPSLQSFLPDTYRLTSVSFLEANFQKRNCWLLKPIKGSQGKGLIKVEKMFEQFIVKEVIQPREEKHIFQNKEHFSKWLHKKMKKNDYIFQPFFLLQNRNYTPFDIRILLQKDNSGQWTERIRVFRTGLMNHITSNLAGGGKMHPFSSLKKNMNSYQKKYVETQLTRIMEALPLAIEASFHPIFELAIDIGMDKDDNLWILDINSKPGHKIVTMATPSVQKEIYEAPGKYCLHLALNMANESGVD